MVTDAINAAKGKMNTMNNKAEIARNMPFSVRVCNYIINTGTQIKLTDCAIRLAVGEVEVKEICFNAEAAEAQRTQRKVIYY
jgi:hypothetical protein